VESWQTEERSSPSSCGRLHASGGMVQFRAVLLERGLAPATINLRLAAVRSAVRLARLAGTIEWELHVPAVPAVPCRETRGPGPGRRPPPGRGGHPPGHGREGDAGRGADLLFDLGLRRRRGGGDRPRRRRREERRQRRREPQGVQNRARDGGRLPVWLARAVALGAESELPFEGLSSSFLEVRDSFGAGRQRWVAAMASLNRGFLIGRDDEVLGSQGLAFPLAGVQVQYTASLVLEVRIAGEDPRAVTPGPDGIGGEPSPDGDAGDLGDQAARWSTSARISGTWIDRRGGRWSRPSALVGKAPRPSPREPLTLAQRIFTLRKFY
jgi:hypothetical protein